MYLGMLGMFVEMYTYVRLATLGMVVCLKSQCKLLILFVCMQYRIMHIILNIVMMVAEIVQIKWWPP